MTAPSFSAQASLYRTGNRYHASVGDGGAPMADDGVVAAYLPGRETLNRCSGCTDTCVGLRSVCIAKVAWIETQACLASFGIACGPIAAWAAFEIAGCYGHYAKCFGICHVPTAREVGWESPCCPKLCAFEPGKPGSGCCDHGEACVGAHNPNTRDGCCPVGQECHGNCCAVGEHCLEGGICSTEPGYFENTYPTPPTPPVNNCIFGGEPCGRKCCLGNEVCCYSPADGFVCKLPPCLG